jgi:hypothetical protein
MSEPNLPTEQKPVLPMTQQPGAPFLIGIIFVTLALALFGVYLFIRSATVSPKSMFLLLIPLAGVALLYKLTRTQK